MPKKAAGRNRQKKEKKGTPADKYQKAADGLTG